MRRLWELLPSGLAGVFRPKVDDVTSEVMREIQRALPAYAGHLEGEFGSTAAAGVQQAIHHFLDRLGNPAAGYDDRGRVFHRLGRHEMQQGRSLDMLQTAYRVGARVSWRRASEVGTRAGIPVATLCLLAEALFAYIDELSALSIEGYAAAQTEATGTLERRRRRLMDLILADPPTAPQSLADFAATAHWAVPERVIAVAMEPADDASEPAQPSFGDDVLVNFEDGAPCLVLPDPGPHRHPALVAGLSHWQSAIGPAVALRDARHSLRCARQALELVRRGVLPAKRVTHCDRHLFELCLFSDAPLTDELVTSALAPLDELPPRQHRKLAGTLLAWLETRGNVREVSRRLQMHPQTVRSHIQQLEGLFGSGLDDPAHRFDLVLALRAARYGTRAG
ncbi:transcriptional regulator, CdaR [Saccharopolyspora erythraea NRRL 2338]|uniref:Transcriptional regulator, CdaR n=1 Tax=Saccharopolyspora erythraea (strain ATCC 11635 / DSM 40517 / JCM 4748 / NBRC 13426 / NCIMB 8594 / NRRL 2338) TaxID=405948 RepID=A4FC78_SACEN|nr:transcriptional regulator, CdaR [Saccharopolyspora erythraea NRRL 2338]